MAERLTKKISKTIQDKYSLGSCLYYDFAEIDDTNKLLNKLGKLEDILEKYGIDVEKLNQMLEWLFTLSGQDADDMKFIARDRKLIHQQYCDIKTDRDTWKRACELACEREDDCYVYDNIHRAYEFYQQAKKEGENK